MDKVHEQVPFGIHVTIKFIFVFLYNLSVRLGMHN